MQGQQTHNRLSGFDYDSERIPAYAGLHIDGPFKYEDDSFYLGQFKKNKRHGRGKSSYRNGGLYEGEWFDDKPHGRGRYITASGDWYLGMVLNGTSEG